MVEMSYSAVTIDTYGVIKFGAKWLDAFPVEKFNGTLNQVPSILWKLPQKSLSISRLEEKAQKMAVRQSPLKTLISSMGV